MFYYVSIYLKIVITAILAKVFLDNDERYQLDAKIMIYYHK